METTSTPAQTSSTPTPQSTPAPSSTTNTPPQSTPVESSSTNTESSLDDRIASAISDLDDSDESTSDPVAETTEAAAAPEAQSQEQEPQSEEDLLAAELGIDPRRNNKIPYAKVKRILANKEKAIREQLSQEYGAAITERETHIQGYQQEFEKIRAAENLMAQDPARFLQGLAQAHPLYNQILAPLFGGEQQGRAQEQQQQYVDESMPQPDYDLGNGTYTYSQEGLQRRMAWERQQAVQEAEQRIMQQISPLLEVHQENQRSQFLNQQYGELQNHISHLSSTLPGFSENFDAIKQVFMEDKSIRSMEHAYDRFMARKNTTDRQKVWAEVVAEMEKRPRGTSTVPNTPVAATDRHADDLDDRIAKAISGL